MNKAEKERKIKIAALIVLCCWVKARKLTDTQDVIINAFDSVFWITEIHKLSQIQTFSIGGIYEK